MRPSEVGALLVRIVALMLLYFSVQMGVTYSFISIGGGQSSALLYFGLWGGLAAILFVFAAPIGRFVAPRSGGDQIVISVNFPQCLEIAIVFLGIYFFIVSLSRVPNFIGIIFDYFQILMLSSQSLL